jgi:hypothetical protein
MGINLIDFQSVNAAKSCSSGQHLVEFLMGWADHPSGREQQTHVLFLKYYINNLLTSVVYLHIYIKLR